MIEEVELTMLQTLVQHHPLYLRFIHCRLRENKYPIMFNFTKKYSNALVDTNELDVGVNEKYNAAIKEIERLEDELSKKTHELSQSFKAQTIMSEGVKNCAAILYTIQNQLITVAAHLARSNKQIFELSRENQALKLSGDEWFRRAIKLEFDVLKAKDGLKKVEDERDLAVKTIELLQVELMSNNRRSNRN